jgi:hypothetical protein
MKRHDRFYDDYIRHLPRVSLERGRVSPDDLGDSASAAAE